MQTREQNGSGANKIHVGPGANMKQLTKIIIDEKTLKSARDFSKAIQEIADTYRANLIAALAAVGYWAPEAETEPYDNPVRFIGIRKGGWKRGRGKRHEQRKIIHTP